MEEVTGEVQGTGGDMRNEARLMLAKVWIPACAAAGGSGDTAGEPGKAEWRTWESSRLGPLWPGQG